MNKYLIGYVTKTGTTKAVIRILLGFNPGKVAVFGARMASGLPGIFKLLFGIPKNAPSDNRDWVAIDAWTDSLAAAIKA